MRNRLRRRYGHGVAAYNRGTRLLRRQLDRDAVKVGRYCGGKMHDGPNKAFGRCSSCGKIDYEKYEGDRCTRIIA